MNKTALLFICSIAISTLTPSLYANSTLSGESNSQVKPSMAPASPDTSDLVINREWCKNNPEECKVKKEEKIKWCRENKEACKAKLEQWCKDNPEECKKKAQTWCDNHPAMCEKIKERNP